MNFFFGLAEANGGMAGKKGGQRCLVPFCELEPETELHIQDKVWLMYFTVRMHVPTFGVLDSISLLIQESMLLILERLGRDELGL